MTPEQPAVIVVGAGHAGLATSHELTRRGVPHLVLEAGRVGEAWRSQRWDSFSLNTPNWTLRLPGHEYAADAPDAFLPRADVVRYLEEYRARHALPVVEGARAMRIERDDDGSFLVHTDKGSHRAPNVVVASGAFHKPRIPPSASAVPAAIRQIHSSQYRNAESLPPGAVLVVGTGQSGGQIAEDLLEAGRRVLLSAGRCPRIVRRYRGRDITRWLAAVGFFDRTPAMLPNPAMKNACNPLTSGTRGGHDIDLRALAAQGARLFGRFEEATPDGRVRFAADLHETLKSADAFNEKALTDIDAYIARAGTAAPPEAHPPPLPPVHDELHPTREIDLAREGVGTIVWATGARPDVSWIEPRVVDERGEVVHERGVTREPGLYFVGLHFQHTARSDLFLGVGDDAAHVAEHVARRAAGKT